MVRSSAVRRSSAMTTPAVLYRGEGDTETEIEVEAFGLVEPYFSGDWDEPPSGGGVEDVRAIFYDGKKQREIQVSADELKELSEALAEAAMDEPEPPEPDDDDFFKEEDEDEDRRYAPDYD